VVTTRAASLAAHGLGASAFSKVTAVVCAVLAFALAGLGVALSTSPRADIAVNAAGQDAFAEGKQPARLDPLGDPLPPGAIMRLGTARWRRPWGVTRIGFSRDGQHVVTASGHTLSMLDTATGTEARQLDATNIMGLAVSHAGGVMATAQNAHVEVRDLVTGKVKISQQTPGFAVALSADGRVLASGGRTRNNADPVVLWDVRTGDKLRSLPGEMYQVFRLAFSPDGKTLAAATCGDHNFSPPEGTRSEIVRLWDVDTGRLHELEGHTGGATSVAFSPDGKILATGAHDGSLILWNAAERKQLHKLRLAEEAYFHRKANGVDSGGILALVFDPSGRPSRRRTTMVRSGFSRPPPASRFLC
jgi:WD40 repeat protein